MGASGPTFLRMHWKSARELCVVYINCSRNIQLSYNNQYALSEISNVIQTKTYPCITKWSQAEKWFKEVCYAQQKVIYFGVTNWSVGQLGMLTPYAHISIQKFFRFAFHLIEVAKKVTKESLMSWQECNQDFNFIFHPDDVQCLGKERRALFVPEVRFIIFKFNNFVSI